MIQLCEVRGKAQVAEHTETLNSKFTAVGTASLKDIHFHSVTLSTFWKMHH